MGNVQANSLHQFPHLAAFDQVIAERFEAIDLSVLMIYLIDSVPASALPYLAEQFDVLGYKGWRFCDTEQKKRDLLKRAIELHRLKGTPWSIREALKIIGYENSIIQEQFPRNYHNGQFNHNGAITRSSYHWAVFRVLIDGMAYPGLTLQQVEDIKQLVYEYKAARSKLLDVSFYYTYLDEVGIEEELGIGIEASPYEDYYSYRHNGAALRDGSIQRNTGYEETEIDIDYSTSGSLTTQITVDTTLGATVILIIIGSGNVDWNDGSPNEEFSGYDDANPPVLIHTYSSLTDRQSIDISGQVLAVAIPTGNLFAIVNIGVEMVSFYATSGYATSIGGTLPSNLSVLLVVDNNLGSVPALPSDLQSLWLSSNSLTSLPTLPSNLNAIDVSDNDLTAIPSIPTGCMYVNVAVNSLSSSALNSLLANLVSNLDEDGVLDIQNQSGGAKPTGQGNIDLQVLLDRGWNISV